MKQQVMGLEVVRQDPDTYSLINIDPWLPEEWQTELMQFALDQGWYADLFPSSTSRRTEGDVSSNPIYTVNGHTIKRYIPWLYEFAIDERVVNMMSTLMEQTVSMPTQENADEFRVIMNILYGPNAESPTGQFYEPHVDNNGATLVLPVTSHPRMGEGELIISTDPSKRGLFSSEDDDVYRVKAKAGQGIVFDGHDKPHYVTSPARDEVRISAIFEYYTKEANADARPDDLGVAIGLNKEDS